jgi:hypothetical protein
MKKILIFIDGLPFYHHEICNSILHGKTRKLKTGLGFSSNQHCLLLGGLNPDQVGFFTDWTLKQNDKNVGFYINHNNLIGYGLNKIAGKIIGYTHSIPIGLHNYFYQKNIYPLKSKKSLVNFNPIFKEFDFFIDNEVESILRNKTLLHERTIFVINKVDSNGHYIGPKNPYYLEYLKNLLKDLKVVIEKNKATYLLFSDHGMSNNPKPFNINMEKLFGKQGKSSYFYFIDSTSIKLWTSKEQLKNKIKNYFESIPEGVLLSEKNRIEYGVQSKNFGDLIFILKNDWYFKNTYFGRGWKSQTFGMHGNWPEHDEQNAIIIDNFTNGKEEIKSDCFYNKVMLEFLKK